MAAGGAQALTVTAPQLTAFPGSPGAAQNLGFLDIGLNAVTANVSVDCDGDCSSSSSEFGVTLRAGQRLTGMVVSASVESATSTVLRSRSVGDPLGLGADFVLNATTAFSQSLTFAPVIAGASDRFVSSFRTLFTDPRSTAFGRASVTYSFTVEADPVAPIPLPAAAPMLLAALAALGLIRRRRPA